jgi:hypothetical protein
MTQKSQKYTPHKWGIAHHIFARVLAAGEERPQRLLRSRSTCQPHTHIHTHTVPNYAPFTTPWGMHNTTQSIDNQQTIFTIPQKSQKNTPHKWGIAHHIFAHVLAAGKEHPQRLLRSRSTCHHYTHYHTHAVPHYALFTTPWGIHKTTQSIDNQINNTTHTPNTLQKTATTNGA